MSPKDKNNQDEEPPSPSESVAQTGIKKTVEGAQTAASISVGVAQIANQTINPTAGLAATGATVAQITADTEGATNTRLSEQERKAAQRELARGAGLLVTDVCVGIGYNCAADVETLGIAAAGTGNAIGIERSVNQMSAQLANFLELPKIQKMMKLGDGTRYANITDMPADAVMSIGGYKILEKLAEYRGKLETAIEKKTGLNVADLHHVTQLGARLTEAGLDLLSGTPPNFDAITAHAAELAKQAGLNTEHGKDLNAVFQVVKSVGNVAKHIDEGKFGFSDLKAIANASTQIAMRAQAHGLIPQFAKDAQVVTELGSTVCALAENVEKGKFSLSDVDKVVVSSKNAVTRLQEREIIGPKTAHDLMTASRGVELATSFGQGKIDAHQIVDVTQSVVHSAQSHGLVGEKTASKIAAITHTALAVNEQIGQISKSIGEVKSAVSEVKTNVRVLKSKKKEAPFDQSLGSATFNIDTVLSNAPPPITHQAETAAHSKDNQQPKQPVEDDPDESKHSKKQGKLH